ncbi:MAG: hypothetical protein AAFY09_03415 [Pseudomonadota bacterium]
MSTVSAKSMKPYMPALILAGFMLAALALWLPGAHSDPAPEPPVLKEIDERLSSGSARLSELMQVTNARPLFHASRRPVAEPEAPAQPKAVLKLLGIIAEDGSETRAFVKLSTSSNLYRIGKGETIGKWRIVDIGREEITVSKDGKKPYTLKIGG